MTSPCTHRDGNTRCQRMTARASGLCHWHETRQGAFQGAHRSEVAAAEARRRRRGEQPVIPDGHDDPARSGVHREPVAPTVRVVADPWEIR